MSKKYQDIEEAASEVAEVTIAVRGQLVEMVKDGVTTINSKDREALKRIVAAINKYELAVAAF